MSAPQARTTASTPGRAAVPPARRRYRAAVVCVLLAAGVWRLVMAALLPAISRDGVVFCWYARDLGQEGVAYLRAPEAQQHPLYPLLILGAQRAARACGAANTPTTWLHAGQAVAWTGGMAVVVLTGVLARRLVRALALPLDERAVVLGALVLAALLDHNIWLSADVMSDQVHLAFYLGAVCLLVRLQSVGAAAACGALAGLAFLTRQEGLLPVAAGMVVLAAQARRGAAWRGVLARGAALAVGFGVCAAPYWVTIECFTRKKDPIEMWRSEQATASLAPADADASGVGPAHAAPLWRPTRGPTDVSGVGDGLVVGAADHAGVRLAKLETVNLEWWALVPFALGKLLRAGRVVVPLLALLPLVNLRRRWADPAWAGVGVCGAGHFLLLLLLLERYGYLAPRHTLVIVMLLTPLAAMLLARLGLLFLQRRWYAAAVVAALVVLLPLVRYAVRIPNAKDRFLVAAATWLLTHDPDRADKTLLSGSSGRRIAFYADMGWQHWPEDPQAYDELAATLRALGSGYFALELEAEGGMRDQFERLGNRALAARLAADPTLADRLAPVHAEPGPDGSVLVLYAINTARAGTRQPRASQ